MGYISSEPKGHFHIYIIMGVISGIRSCLFVMSDIWKLDLYPWLPFSLQNVRMDYYWPLKCLVPICTAILTAWQRSTWGVQNITWVFNSIFINTCIYLSEIVLPCRVIASPKQIKHWSLWVCWLLVLLTEYCHIPVIKIDICLRSLRWCQYPESWTVQVTFSKDHWRSIKSSWRITFKSEIMIRRDDRTTKATGNAVKITLLQQMSQMLWDNVL